MNCITQKLKTRLPVICRLLIHHQGYLLSWFSLPVLTWHWSCSGAWTWSVEWYRSSKSSLISKRICPCLLVSSSGNKYNINQKENYRCFCQSSMGSVTGEHSEKQKKKKKKEEGGYQPSCGWVVKLAYSVHWFCNMTPLSPPERRW